MGKWSKDSMIKAAVLAGGIAVILITITVIRAVQNDKAMKNVEAGATITVTEAPVEDPVEEPTVTPVTRQVSEGEKIEIADIMQMVLNIRYRGEYTQEDKAYIKDNFTEDSYKMIDDFYSDISEGIEDTSYVNVEALYQEAKKKLEKEQQRVKNYKYDTYEDYLHGEYPQFYEEDNDSVSGDIPDWYYDIQSSYEYGDVKWDGCTAEQAKENGTLEYYFDTVYPDKYGISAENREFDYEVWEKQQNKKDVTEEVPLPKEEWEDTYKKADVPKYIYDSDAVKINEQGEHIVYSSSFPESQSKMTIYLSGYEYEITKADSEEVTGWSNTRGKDWYNFVVSISSYEEASIEGNMADIEIEIMSTGKDKNGNVISVDNYMDLSYTNDGRIQLSGLSELSRME